MVKPGFDVIPRLRPYRTLASNKLYAVLDTFRYTDSKGKVWEGPRGMLTDLASIPDLAQWAFGNVDHRVPGAMHDAQYLLSKVTGVQRHTLDQLFAEMCGTMGANEAQQAALHAGLDLGGWHSWNECQAAGVTWADFDVSLLSDQEIADYRVRFKIPDIPHITLAAG
jgi:hypothetical protein